MGKVTAIEIGLYYTKVCEADFRARSTKVYKSFIFDTPENTIEDGYIRDKGSFADELRRQLRLHKFKNKNFVFTIASNKILSREVTIPAVKDNRIMDIVRAEANDYFPMDISEHVLTYSLLESMPETKQKKIMVFAAPLTLVRNYYGLADMLDVNVVALDYIGNSAYQAMRRLGGGEVNFVVQINQQNTLVSILRGGALAMQRNVNFGVASILDVMRGYSSFENLSPAECYDLICKKRFIKKHLGVTDDEVNEIAVEIVDDVMDEVFQFVNNINRIIEYYNANEQEHKVDRIYLVGRGTKIMGISELLKNELNLPVEIVKSLHGISFRKYPPELKEHLDELFSCAGAAINPASFVPEELVQKSIKKDNLRLYILLFILVLVATGSMIFNGFLTLQEEKEKQKELLSERDQYLFVQEIYNTYERSLAAMTEADWLSENADSYNDRLNELIAALEELLPTNCIVQSLSVSEDAVFISFVADGKETAAQLLVQLKKIPYLGTISISGITENAGESGDATVTFSVSMTWNPDWEEVSLGEQ